MATVYTDRDLSAMARDARKAIKRENPNAVPHLGYTLSLDSHGNTCLRVEWHDPKQTPWFRGVYNIAI